MTLSRDGKRGFVVAGLAVMVVYGSLKTAWALGSRVGVRDVDEWDWVFGALSGFEYWLALWGTVVLALSCLSLSRSRPSSVRPRCGGPCEPLLGSSRSPWASSPWSL